MAYDYKYDHERDVFVTADGNVIDGMTIIDGLYDSHIATVDSIKGRLFQWKLTSRHKGVSFCEMVEEFLKWLIKIICGRTLKSDDTTRGIFDIFRLEDMKLLKTESIDVFGYKASKNVIVVFCILILFGYSFLHWTRLRSSWLTSVANNSLLSLAFGILVISILDHILPICFLWVVNRLIKLRWRLLSGNMRFN